MIENPMRRVAAILLTALMVFSTVIVVEPQGVASATTETNDIMIKVKDTSYVDIPTASVKFTEVHTGQVITAAYSGTDAAYHSGESTPAGYYRIDVSASRYYSIKNVTGFKFDGTSPTTLPTVTMTKFGNDQYTYVVTVKDTSSNPISGATVKLYNPTMDQFVNSSTSSSSGIATMKVFGGTNFNLTVSAQNYETNSTNIGVISSSGSITVKLNDSLLVYRDVRKASGSGTTYASNVVSYLYNINTNMPMEKRILKSTGSSARFDAYPGNWILVIDGSNVNPHVENLALSADSIQTIILSNQTQSTEDRTITWSTWNAMNVVTDAVWNADKTYLGLDYSDIGCLRAQVDLTLGDANGDISASEYVDFVDLLQNDQAPDWVTTAQSLHVSEISGSNKTQYVSTNVNAVTISDFTGAVTATTAVTYTSDVDYISQVTLRAAADYYQMLFDTALDTASMNRSFEFNLISGYEMVSNTSDSSSVKITGYEVLTVNPLLSTVPGTAHTSLDIEKSASPVAKGELITGVPNVYAKLNKTGVLLYYIVKANSNVTFSSSKSSDPNSNLLTYNWSFGDAKWNTTKAKEVVHNYTTAANRTVTLNVTDVIGNVNTTKFNVRVDGRVPKPAIRVMNSTGGNITVYTVNQGDSLKFNATGSVDDLYTASDGLGTVQSYSWKFGNDAPYEKLASVADQTEIYNFAKAGLIKVVLNVTDVVGNWKNMTISVNVTDKTAPTVSLLKTLNATWGITLIERSIIYFDATSAADNVDNASALAFKWTFGDNKDNISGVGLSYANVTHNYSSYGQYDLTLNVTDSSGNNLTMTRVIYIGIGDRPNVFPDIVTFDPKTFEEGVSGRITVNITNKGTKAANDISVEVWWYSGTIAQKRIGNISLIYDKNGTQISSLAAGQSGYGYIDWTPESKGNYSIRAVVNSTDQPSSNWGSGTINVKEAAWKGIVVPIAIVIIVVAVPIIMIARRRIGSTGAMRRPKKEKEEKVKEKKEEK